MKILMLCCAILMLFADKVRCDTMYPFDIITSISSKDPKTVKDTLRYIGLEPESSCRISGIQVLMPKTMNSIFILLGVSFYPNDGYLIIIDCKGRVNTKIRVGRIKSIGLARLNEDKDDDYIVVDVITGVGSGTRQDNFLILYMKDNSFHRVWHGTSYEHELPMTVSPDDNYQIYASMKLIDINKDHLCELIYSTDKILYTYDSKTNNLRVGRPKTTSEAKFCCPEFGPHFDPTSSVAYPPLDMGPMAADPALLCFRLHPRHHRLGRCPETPGPLSTASPASVIKILGRWTVMHLGARTIEEE